MTKKTDEGASRRDFLKMAAVAAPAVAVATVQGTSAEAAEPDLNENKIQDTAHTRAYLDSARF